jgi:general secretion pathway protein M
MNQLKLLIGNVQSWLAALSTRERRMVFAAAGAVGVFALFFTLNQISSAGHATERRIQDKLAKLQEVQELASSYSESENKRQAMERQLSSNGVKLISYIQEKGTTAGLDIQSMNPKSDSQLAESSNIVESGVELTLTDVNIRKLVDFLTSVEVGGAVKVKTLRMEPHKATDNLTAWLTIVTYRLKP